MEDFSKVKPILRPLDYKGVVLKKGKFQSQFEEAVEYFLAIPNEDILYGFRKRAGKRVRLEEILLNAETI